jgi:hypothetical protein
MKYLILMIFFIIQVQWLLAQSKEAKNSPFIKTGYGYFNEYLLIDGNILSSEVGLRTKTSYILSVKLNFADAVNGVGNFQDVQGKNLNFIYSYKWISFNTGYEFLTKNQKHSFIPMAGFYLYNNLMTYPNFLNDGDFELRKENYSDIGIELTFQYLYNFKDGFSIGLNTSGCIGYNSGPIHFTVMPVVAIRLE